MNSNENKIEITKKSRVELEEMISREQKLLANKSFLARLPDKGSKIKDFYNKLCSELEKHKNIDQTADILSKMQITTSDALNSLEWNEKNITGPDIEINPISEANDNNELQILASSTTNLKQIRIIKPDPSLITEQDLKECESSSLDDDLDVYSKNIMKFQADHQYGEKKKFKPFYTTKSDVHNPKNEKHRKRYTEEITSATPPALQHEKTVILSLYDSIQLQMKQKDDLDKIQQQNAVERIQRLNKVLKNHGIDSNLPIQPNEQFSKFFTKYRDGNSSDSDDLSNNGMDSDLEEHDDDDEPRGGGVNVVVYS